MRTSLFLSTLFAVSLLGGAAFAEKSGAAGTSREPRVVERLRAHGDTADKVYRSADAGARPSGMAPSTQAPAPASHARIDPGANRVNCSDTGVDCLAAKGKAAGHAPSAGGDPSSRHDTRPPAFLDKVLGSDRTNFNEAGEDQGMSVHAAQRAWSRASGVQSGGDKTVVTIGVQKEVDRKSHQASSARMASGEDDVGFMSPKAARKEWAKASIAAGTWKGPVKEPISNAEIRITEQRAHEGAADKHDEHQAGHGRDAHASDHPH